MENLNSKLCQKIILTDPYFTHHLENLQKLHADLEKQLQNFDEVVPYERQRTAQIYSPRLLNMMLVCGAQIEAITKLISEKCKTVVNNEGIRPLIRKINEKSVLSNFNITSIPHKMQFTPFAQDMEWWSSYNELKHDLDDKQFKITYTTIMNAFAALSALHCLADRVINAYDADIEKILDSNNWFSKETDIRALTVGVELYLNSPFWRSLLFEIHSLYRPPI